MQRQECSRSSVSGFFWYAPRKSLGFPNKTIKLLRGERAPVLLVDRSTEPTAPSCPLLFLKVGLQVLLFFFFGLRRQLGQTVGGQGGRTTLLHTDSSAGSSRGLMYSNPSNSDWSILLMTSLRRRKREKMERMRRCCFVTNPGTQRHL